MTIPVSIKVIVAKIERFDRFAIPQMPCPLVQPLPSRVPIPTKNPPSAISHNGYPCRGIKKSGEMKLNITVPNIKPQRKTARQIYSLLGELNKPFIMPLMPAMRPLNNKRMVTLRPIKAPPSKAEYGVKFSTKYLN